MVYIVNTYDVHDWEKYKQYLPQVAVLLKKYGATVLALQRSPKTFEGVAKMMNMIVKFPSQEVVETFYNDPEYKKIIDLRLDATSNCTIMLLNEYEQ